MKAGLTYMHGPDECVHLECVVEVVNVLANYMIKWSERKE